jgi:peptidoglycan hydrolase FlgJ
VDNITAFKDTKVSVSAKTTTLTQKQIEQNKKLKKACADFEAAFTYYLFKTMRQTIPTGSSINQYAGKDTFNMLMDQKIAEELSNKNGGLGIQKIMYNQLVTKINNSSDK